jgi:hypothetical protein
MGAVTSEEAVLRDYLVFIDRNRSRSSEVMNTG